MNKESIADPESGNLVRFTDNGMKDGDLPGIDPTGLSYEEILAQVRQMAGVDVDNS